MTLSSGAVQVTSIKLAKLRGGRLGGWLNPNLPKVDFASGDCCSSPTYFQQSGQSGQSVRQSSTNLNSVIIVIVVAMMTNKVS